MSEEARDTVLAENLAILFKFDELDFLNIVVRVVHSLAGLAWFGLIGVILAARWFMDPESRYRAILKLKQVFAPAAGLSLAILLGSGIYNAIWDSPIRPPGVLALNALLAVPFGDMYFLAFLGKLLAYVVLVIVALRIGKELYRLPAQLETSGDASESIQDIGRLAMVGGGAAIFLAIDIAVLIYMHYISHLAIVIPQ
jgi:hypothetical protein